MQSLILINAVLTCFASFKVVVPEDLIDDFSCEKYVIVNYLPA
jgi:hypothetical protein